MSQKEKEWYEEMVKAYKKEDQKGKTEKKIEIEEKAKRTHEKQTELRKSKAEATRKSGKKNK